MSNMLNHGLRLVKKMLNDDQCYISCKYSSFRKILILIDVFVKNLFPFKQRYAFRITNYFMFSLIDFTINN